VRIEWRATHPLGGTNLAYPTDEVLNPLSAEIGQDVNVPATASVTLLERAREMADNYAALNPTRTDAMLECWAVDETPQVCLWRGYVGSRSSTLEAEGGAKVSLSLGDMQVKLRGAQAAVGALKIGELLSTAGIELDGTTPFTLLPVIVGSLSFMPAPASWPAAYYPFFAYAAPGGYLETALDATGASSTTAFSSSLFDRGMLSKGFLRVGLTPYEIIYYDGYDAADVGTGSMYVWKNLTRGCFGTTPISPYTPASTKLWQLIPKRIHHSVTPVVYGLVGAVLEVIDPGNYSVNAEDGRIEFRVNPLTTAMTPPLTAIPSEIRAYYKVSDETAATAYILGGDNTYGVIEKLLATVRAYGGPELSSSDWDIVLDRMPITRLALDAPALLGAALDSLLTDPGQRLFRTLPATDVPAADPVPCVMIGTWMDYGTASAVQKLVVRQLPLSTAAIRVPHSTLITEDADQREVYSAIVVYYQDVYDPTAAPQAQLVTLTGSYDVYGRGGTILKMVAQVLGLMPILHCAPPLDLGQCSAGAAISIGRATLLRSLLLARSKSYTVPLTPLFPLPPAPGVNHTMSDGYTGTCMGWSASQAGDAIQAVRMRVVNLLEVPS
jgi:hypothetical protein